MTRSKPSVQVDCKGMPMGKEVDLLHKDLIAFAKEMDPSLGWSKQTKDARNRLMDRVYEEWNVVGNVSRLSEKYIGAEVIQALINNRYNLGVLIDAGLPKPPDVLEKYWKKLCEKRATPESKEKFALMASIAKTRGFRNSTRQRVEKAAEKKLVFRFKF
jgi:hypothetical protein